MVRNNPGLIQQAAASNPQMAQMLQANPHMQQMMEQMASIPRRYPRRSTTLSRDR